MKTRKIAEICHQVNRALCQGVGDYSQKFWENAPGWQKESMINGVQFHLDNPNATYADSHKNWMKEKIADGWLYGKEKDPIKKTHPCLVPFDALPKHQQLKDVLVKNVVDYLR